MFFNVVPSWKPPSHSKLHLHSLLDKLVPQNNFSSEPFWIDGSDKELDVVLSIYTKVSDYQNQFYCDLICAMSTLLYTVYLALH